MMRDAEGRFRRESWDEALNRGGARVRAIIAAATAQTPVAIYLSGQLLTEDYYVPRTS